MIIYHFPRWSDALFVWTGTVWPTIRWKIVMLFIFSFVLWAATSWARYNLGSEGRSLSFGTLSFLLIFRSNQACARYWEGRTALSNFFSAVRGVVSVALFAGRGGNHTSAGVCGPTRATTLEATLGDHADQRIREMRVDVARLCIAFCVALKLHMRMHPGYTMGRVSKSEKWHIDWDLLRLHQLLADEEFETLAECIGFASKEPPKLPYTNLCKTLLCIFLFSLPLCIDFRLGFFANTILPVTISTILLGLDVIATELENPFGDDLNDLDVLDLVHSFECDVMTMLTLTGDALAVDRLCWRKVPGFINETSCRELRWLLVVKAYAAPELVATYSDCDSRSDASDLDLEATDMKSPGSDRSSALE
eukprot:NODE_11139_length_1305_cov_5.281834.p1 GENE.NODE_11139_length_1305_cov_5.281834~~NODE_11139_length_1305_cov_5.281834.p1  ORF type:complete len:364 (+),score=98.30 NODE_11139_length_1305_cov_5.281834:163-1254(+)